MEKQYNLYNLEPSFKKYLLTENISPISLKNYMSDFRHFAGWMTQKIKDQKLKIKDEELIIKTDDIFKYKSYLELNNIPHKTINRRLSTVRKFCSFCISQGWMKENPAKKILNIKSQISNPNILDQFKSDLEKENLDQSVITSYLDDIRDFLLI